MQTHALWHTPATQISFIGTALLLGFGSVIPWLQLQGKKPFIHCISVLLSAYC
ncbi:hypothetical protein I3679_015140 [Proteus mirabilis]|uniref:Uncharacterized protein n=1 Tax=Proteus mirabilis TaxID=584 RepID=A0ABD5LW84_PROMI